MSFSLLDRTIFRNENYLAPFFDWMNVRLATNDDSSSIVEIVSLCYKKYAYELFLKDEPELLLPVESFDVFFVLVTNGRVVGTVAGVDYGVLASPRFELKKLYLHPDVWGGGGAKMLEGAFVSWAASLGGGDAELWSDVLFVRAHSFYRKCGWRKEEFTRSLEDTNGPYTEFLFRKTIEGQVGD